MGRHNDNVLPPLPDMAPAPSDSIFAGMLPSGLFDWFWLLGAALMLLNAGLVYAGAGALVRAGRATENERRRFAIGLAAATAGFCLAVQAVVWSTGESRPECLAALPPSTPASLATNLLALLGSALLLVWVWAGGGADTLARFAPTMMRNSSSARTYAPAQVRRFVTGFVVIASIGGIAASLIVPSPPDCRGRPTTSNDSAP
jgi:hypothetical protein